ncbi:hypothetical protein [Falsirhodobacter sp. alg1]|uniref:hypothetical protein n=1 Tax=Falsirhodobacter sp. alg1 TaxID=1472418 RepID=UPI000789932C|nr:hypothetical protein [Falsirhodobacter sp. alg1]
MAYQFVHIQTYSDKLTRVEGTKDQYNDINQVFLEVGRDPRYSSHVADPEPPVPILAFGAIPVSALRKMHDERRAQIRETVTLSGGSTYQRRLKTDAPTLYTEIHSHPMTAEDYKAAPREEKLRVQQWAKFAVSDFSRRMPEGVAFSAVLHLDEGHVHIHILGVNMHDPKLSANKLHVGKVAAEEWRQAHGPSDTLAGLPKPQLQDRPKKPKKPKPSKTPATQRKRDAKHAEVLAEWETECDRVEQANALALERWEIDNNAHLRVLRKARKAKTGDVEAYEAAMTAFQSRYHDAVGKRAGLLRSGPGAERLTTKQYDARKKQARVDADHDAAMRAQVARQRAERAEITVDATGIVEEKAALAHQHAELDAAENALAEREHEIARRDAALGAAEDSMRKKEKVQEEADRTLSQRAVAMRERERVFEKQKQNLTMRMEAFRRDAAARQADLDSRERKVADQQIEVAEAASAMEDMVDQLDTGMLTAEDGNLRLGRIHAFVGHAIGTPADRRSPMQRVVAKFAGLLVRAASALSGGVTPIVEDENRPGM